MSLAPTQNLTFNELLDARQALETKLRAAIEPLYEEFRSNTGVSPDHITIELIDITMKVQPTRQYRLGPVHVRLATD